MPTKVYFQKSSIKRKKARVALALAVSLWMGGAGLYAPVASADSENKTVTVESGESFKYVFNGIKANASPSAYGAGAGIKTDFHTIVNGGSVTQGTFGGYSQNNKVYQNKVTLINAICTGEVTGGVSESSPSTYNEVNITGSIVSGGTIYGGRGRSGADHNTVTVTNSTLKSGTRVYGGVITSGGDCTYNTVSLTNSTIDGQVCGGKYGTDNITGNTLNLYGVNSANSVRNFDTINIKSAKWGSSVLTISGVINNHDGSLPTINTEGITFTGIDAVKAADETPLINGGMTAYAGHEEKIVGKIYRVGSTLRGEGHGVLDGANLKFVADTSVGNLTVQEQTHNTVMGAEVGMAALSAGNDFVGAATEGLAMAGNAGADGLATYANMGGGSMNVETGSHVKTHTWNAILALGHKNEKKLFTTEYGAFFEYGTGNYSTFNGAERGDGSTHYTGGGILGKCQKNNGFYVEGSLRAGSIHDDATNVLRDVNGNPYSYDTDASYWGGHIGVGREIKLNAMDVLDLYAKYFYNHRGSVSFDAGGHYDLDAVESSVLRIGTRYTVKKNDKVNFYGGLALEHEFCGRATGTADGVAIRGADISGTSVRGEIGVTFQPEDNSPVTLDLNLSGFAGKKRGLTGGLSAVFHF